MRNRKEELNQMKQDYQKPNMSPEQIKNLKATIEKAKKSNRKVFKTIAAAAASVVLLLTVLPNASGDLAYAMSRIPILSKWVEVVTFRDYKYESERNNADIQVPEIVPQIPTETANGTEQTDAAQKKVQKTAEEINAEIKTITDQLIKEFKEFAEDQEGYQDVHVDSEVIATTEQYFTLKLNCYQASGSGAEWNYFYTIDLETGERLKLSGLFTEDSDYITAISENIKQQMKEQMAKDENLFYWVDNKDMPELNFEKITDETQFYLNNNGEVVICFNEGDVAPMYMGCREFVIPNDRLKAIRK